MQDINQTLRYAFFDVDGTVIAKDSFRIILRELIFKHSKPRLLLACFLCSVLSIFALMGFVGKTQFKSALLWCATVGLTPRECLSRIRRVVDANIKPLWFNEVKGELEALRSQGLRICYVSASGEFWLRRLLNAMDEGPKLIVGSRLMYRCGGLMLRGENCLGEEKIRRLKAVIPHHAIWAIAYSDHRADLPLLSASKARRVINPTNQNLKAFQKNLGEQGLTVLQWTVAGPKSS